MQPTVLTATAAPEEAVIGLLMQAGRRLRTRHPEDQVDPSTFPLAKQLHAPRRACGVSDLAVEVELDASTVSRQIKQLEDKGIVERTARPGDGRASLVRLTDRRTQHGHARRLPPPLRAHQERRSNPGARTTAAAPEPARPTGRDLRDANDRAAAEPDDLVAPETDSRPMTETHTPDAQGYLSHRQILVVMGGLMAGMFLAALDQSIVGTALPRITSELGGLDKLSWVVTAYLLTQTASTPLWGKISDLYGRKLIFQAAIITFLVGSLMSGPPRTSAS